MDDQLFIIDTSADPRLAILPSLNTPNSNNHISKLTTEIQQPIVAPLPSSIAHSPPSLLSRPPPSTLISSPTRDPISTSTSTRANEDLLQLKHPDEPDPTESAPAAQRYWKEPTGITCTICHEPDHSARNCDHQLVRSLPNPSASTIPSLIPRTHVHFIYFSRVGACLT